MKCSGSGGGKNRARDQNHFKSKSVDFDEIGKLNSKIQRSNAKTEPKRVINWHLNETAGLTKGVRKSIKKNEREAAAVGGPEVLANGHAIALELHLNELRVA